MVALNTTPPLSEIDKKKKKIRPERCDQDMRNCAPVTNQEIDDIFRHGHATLHIAKCLSLRLVRNILEM